MNIYNFEAEAAVLGSVLNDATLFKSLTVMEDYFYNKAHQTIFQAMKRVQEQEQAIDLVTVTTNLGEEIRKIGGTSYLIQLAESVATTANLHHYEQLIFDAYRNRKSRELAIKYADSPCEESLEKLIGNLQNCRDIGGRTDVNQTFDYLLEITDSMCSGEQGCTGFPTSYKELDEMTGGLQPGELIIVAARPSVGKTAFALNLAAGHCRNNGTSSIFSLEMGTKQLLQRMVSAEGQIHNQKWRSMAFNEGDYKQAMDAVGKISNWNLYIHDRTRTISDIRASIRKTVHDHPDKFHIAIIDYLQLIMPASRKQRRDLEVGEMTRELKLLAMELDMPIVLLSQLSRSVEQRQNKRPLMSDLRESGNIEQDADMIAFLYRDDYYDMESDKENIIEVILSKQRNGPTGTIELAFEKEFGQFVQLQDRGSR